MACSSRRCYSGRFLAWRSLEPVTQPTLVGGVAAGGVLCGLRIDVEAAIRSTAEGLQLAHAHKARCAPVAKNREDALHDIKLTTCYPDTWPLAGGLTCSIIFSSQS